MALLLVSSLYVLIGALVNSGATSGEFEIKKAILGLAAGIGAVYTFGQFFTFLRSSSVLSEIFGSQRRSIFNEVGRKRLMVRLSQAATVVVCAAIISKSSSPGNWATGVLALISAVLVFEARQIFVRLINRSYGASADDVKEVARRLIKQSGRPSGDLDGPGGGNKAIALMLDACGRDVDVGHVVGTAVVVLDAARAGSAGASSASRACCAVAAVMG